MELEIPLAERAVSSGNAALITAFTSKISFPELESWLLTASSGKQ